ncbi:MAG TPA: DEAD/DEAH box helicase family protein [Roseiflexaceae bacterium]|nr:DEAD/DEAH box helicase family protein [Roseiflexaceae bacterium]
MQFLTPAYHLSSKSPRSYQEIAINRAVEAVLRGKQRILLTLATSTGKTVVAFQICWKLWSAGWNRSGAYHKPKILYLADRNILIDDPKIKSSRPSEMRAQPIRRDDLHSGMDGRACDVTGADHRRGVT